MRPLVALLVRPFTEILYGLERCLVPGVTGLLRCFAGLAIGWWIYVPIHELLHAFGCELGGGRVWRLELDPLYGGALLERWLHFVEAGGDYAGRLAGFDTGGSDVVHLMTTGLPFVLTIFPGVWWMRRGARCGSGLVFGAALVAATGPFLSLTGDAYEIGSLYAVQLAPWSSAGARAALVGDDAFVIASGLAGSASTATWLGFVLASTLALAWAYAAWAVGAATATRLGQPPVEALARARQRPRRDR
ncbi:MAG TPA: hypothetical protein VMS86_09850 [Thermoanaerobaculia bacterium]|nr:hypothetical protein [Thermoanaerobaculia bacterium]